MHYYSEQNRFWRDPHGKGILQKTWFLIDGVSCKGHFSWNHWFSVRILRTLVFPRSTLRGDGETSFRLRWNYPQGTRIQRWSRFPVLRFSLPCRWRAIRGKFELILIFENYCKIRIFIIRDKLLWFQSVAKGLGSALGLNLIISSQPKINQKNDRSDTRLEVVCLSGEIPS